MKFIFSDVNIFYFFIFANANLTQFNYTVCCIQYDHGQINI